MKRIKAEELQDGDVVATDIYNFYNQKITEDNVNLSIYFVIRKGNKINERRKNFLMKTGVKDLYVMDEHPNIQLDDIIELDTRKKLTMALEHKNIDDIIKYAKDIVLQVVNKEEIFLDSMQNLRNKHNQIYEKSLNVCLTSLAVAKHIGIKDISMLNNIAIAGLLHNLGECFLSNNEAVKKYFGEESIAYKYINEANNLFMAGYLSDNTNINLKTLSSIAFYKENVDGSGLLHHDDEHISIESKILRVCTDYDTLVNDNDKTPIEALGEMQSHSDTFYSHKILNTLIRTVAFYKLGEEVTLSNGCIGIVYKNNIGCPDRPVVMIENNKILNLLNHNDITIVADSKQNNLHR